MKYIDVEKLKEEIERRRKFHDDAVIKFCNNRTIALTHSAGLKEDEELLSFIDSLQQEPIEKDEETEKLIVCDIIEATIARINGGKKDEEKEENIMREKIAYLRDLGLKAK